MASACCWSASPLPGRLRRRPSRRLACGGSSAEVRPPPRTGGRRSRRRTAALEQKCPHRMPNTVTHSYAQDNGIGRGQEHRAGASMGLIEFDADEFRPQELSQKRRPRRPLVASPLQRSVCAVAVALEEAPTPSLRRRCSTVPVAATKTPPFAAASQFQDKPSDGLEPSTPSLPWRIRVAAMVRRFALHRAVSPAISRIES